MSDKLGRLLFDYGSRVRRYRSRVDSQIESLAGLSERDVVILEFVNSKTEVTFGQIAGELSAVQMPRAAASTVSQAISVLFVERKLVEKRLNPKDQRQPLITLTESGKVLVEEIQQVRRQILIKVKETMELDDQDATMLEDALERGIRNFDKLLGDRED